MELAEKRDARLGKLSGGQRQRVALACALVGDPELLFLDEPTTGLDPQARLKVWEIVEGFLVRGGTVLLTTHYMEEAARLCRRVAILDHGRVIAQGTPAELVPPGTPSRSSRSSWRRAGRGRARDLPGVSRVTERDGAQRLHVPDIGRPCQPC